MGSEEMKHKTNAEYVTLLSFFDSTPSDLKKILQEQPIQHTDDNESRSLIFPLQSTLALRTPRYYGPLIMRTTTSPRFLAINDWNKLPLLRTLAITGLRTLSCPQARHFSCFFSRYSGLLSTSSKILTRVTQIIKRRYKEKMTQSVIDSFFVKE